MTDLLAATADLVNRHSVSFEEADFVAWLETELADLAHLELTRIGDNLIARTNLGRRQRLLLVGHTDTVPVNDNGVARIDGNTLWGVGSADMKGGLACFLELARTVTEPSVDLTYVFYAREEVGQEHNGLKEIHEVSPDLLDGDCAILGEPTDGAIEAGCQGAMRFEVRLAGARAHTARPWMGRNAVHRLAPILNALAEYEARCPTIDGCTYRESLQAVNVEGGVAGNVVPDRAVLRIHHRYAPDRTAAEAEAFVRDFLSPYVELDTASHEGEATSGHVTPDVGNDEIVVVDQSDACPPSLTHPLLQKLITDNDLEISAKLGWTDVARFASFGLPATNFGSGDATVAHTQGEHLHRDSIERTYAALLNLVT